MNNKQDQLDVFKVKQEQLNELYLKVHDEILMMGRAYSTCVSDITQAVAEGSIVDSGDCDFFTAKLSVLNQALSSLKTFQAYVSSKQDYIDRVVEQLSSEKSVDKTA